jgi:hypothetical protein
VRRCLARVPEAVSASPGNVDWVDTIANELFAPLTRDQQLAVNLTAEAFFQAGRRWPTFQFVEQNDYPPAAQVNVTFKKSTKQDVKVTELALPMVVEQDPHKAPSAT